MESLHLRFVTFCKAFYADFGQIHPFNLANSVSFFSAKPKTWECIFFHTDIGFSTCHPSPPQPISIIRMPVESHFQVLLIYIRLRRNFSSERKQKIIKPGKKESEFMLCNKFQFSSSQLVKNISADCLEDIIYLPQSTSTSCDTPE